MGEGRVVTASWAESPTGSAQLKGVRNRLVPLIVVIGLLAGCSDADDTVTRESSPDAYQPAERDIVRTAFQGPVQIVEYVTDLETDAIVRASVSTFDPADDSFAIVTLEDSGTSVLLGDGEQAFVRTDNDEWQVADWPGVDDLMRGKVAGINDDIELRSLKTNILSPFLGSAAFELERNGQTAVVAIDRNWDENGALSLELIDFETPTRLLLWERNYYREDPISKDELRLS